MAVSVTWTPPFSNSAVWPPNCTLTSDAAAGVVGEAMVALVLADAMRFKFGGYRNYQGDGQAGDEDVWGVRL